MFELILEPEEKILQPYCGAMVCLNMKNGTRKIGRMTACSAGRLILNGEEGEIPEAKVSRKKSARRANRSRSREMQAASGSSHMTDEMWGELSIAPIGMESYASVTARESIPLRTVESVMIL